MLEWGLAGLTRDHSTPSRMTQGDVCPDALTYTALIGTCQQDEQWQLALTLLQQMLQEKLVKWSAQL